MPNVKDTRRVDKVLHRFGLGGLDWTAATAANGKNDNWLGSTIDGCRIFVKTIVGSDAEVIHGLRRTEAFYRAHAESAQMGALPTTALIGQDDPAAVQVFDGLDGARNGQQIARDNTFDTRLAAKAGAAIGALHGLSPTSLIALEPALPALPEHNVLRGLTMDLFYESSHAQLEAWHMVQQDPVIVQWLRSSGRSRADHVRVPIHGDLRLDQFLVRENRLYLTDWEMFQLADPARDIGNFVGEWLHHAVIQFLRGRMRKEVGRPVPVPNIALTPDRRPWSQARPIVESFWHAYRSAHPDLSADLAPRATIFACWHLLERLFIDALPSALAEAGRSRDHTVPTGPDHPARPGPVHRRTGPG